MPRTRSGKNPILLQIATSLVNRHTLLFPDVPSAQSTFSPVASTAGAGRMRTFSFTLVVLHCPCLHYLRVLRALLPFLTLTPISSSIHSFQFPVSLFRHSISRPRLHSSSECLASTNTPCKASFDQSSSPLHKTPRIAVSTTRFFTFIIQVTYVRLRAFFHTLVDVWLDRLQFWDWCWWHLTFFPWDTRFLLAGPAGFGTGSHGVAWLALVASCFLSLASPVCLFPLESCTRFLVGWNRPSFWNWFLWRWMAGVGCFFLSFFPSLVSLFVLGLSHTLLFYWLDRLILGLDLTGLNGWRWWHFPFFPMLRRLFLFRGSSPAYAFYFCFAFCLWRFPLLLLSFPWRLRWTDSNDR